MVPQRQTSPAGRSVGLFCNRIAVERNFLGLISLVAALTALICDGIRSIVDQTLYISTVGSIRENIPQSWFAALQPTIEQLAAVWHEVFQPYFLKQPVWLVLAIIGAISMWAKEEAADRTRAR
jgi:hypothetical protein